MLFTEEGISIYINDKQFPNKYELIEVTEEGTLICFNDIQLKNAFRAINVIDEGDPRVINSSNEQSLK